MLKLSIDDTKQSIKHLKTIKEFLIALRDTKIDETDGTAFHLFLPSYIRLFTTGSSDTKVERIWQEVVQDSDFVREPSLNTPTIKIMIDNVLQILGNDICKLLIAEIDAKIKVLQDQLRVQIADTLLKELNNN